MNSAIWVAIILGAVNLATAYHSGWRSDKALAAQRDADDQRRRDERDDAARQREDVRAEATRERAEGRQEQRASERRHAAAAFLGRVQTCLSLFQTAPRIGVGAEMAVPDTEWQALALAAGEVLLATNDDGERELISIIVDALHAATHPATNLSALETAKEGMRKFADDWGATA